MEPQIVPLLVQLMAANLGLTISSLVLFVLHFWAFALYLRRGLRESTASLERIEASAERIAQLVHDLHRDC